MLFFGMHFSPDEELMQKAASEIAVVVLNGLVKEAAEIARTGHTFTNRTGALQSSIGHTPATGDFMQGTLEASIQAVTDYAGFVEYGTSRNRAYPFLRPAIDSVAGTTNALEPHGYF